MLITRFVWIVWTGMAVFAVPPAMTTAVVTADNLVSSSCIKTLTGAQRKLEIHRKYVCAGSGSSSHVYVRLKLML